MSARPWVAGACLALALAGARPTLARSHRSGFAPDLYSLRGWGGGAVPLSPRGPDSFAVSYAQAPSGGGGLFAHWAAWGLGLEGTGASFAHQQLDHTSVNLAAGALVLERAFWPEEGVEEGPLLQIGIGAASAELVSAYPGGQAWSGAAAKLGIGYRFVPANHLRLDLVVASWSLLGDEKRDTITVGDLGVQVGLWW